MYTVYERPPGLCKHAARRGRTLNILERPLSGCIPIRAGTARNCRSR
ncbi:hypothetical protein P3T21_007030 [Paraburkholderia sp. GAS334]